MDRDRLERERRLKRPAADLERGNDRARERDLRPHLDREQERRMQRDREAAAARQREQDRREEERLRAQMLQNPRGRDAGRGDQWREDGPLPPPPPPPARGASSGAAANANLTCYKCGKPGHVQAGCTEEAHCVKCDRNGHVSALCPGADKLPNPI